MEIIVKIFYTLLLIGVGVAILMYRKIIHDWTGNWVWAEKYIGRGGTYLVIMLIGLVFIFYGATYPFGGIPMLFGN